MFCVLLFGRALMRVHGCLRARLNFGAVTSPMQHECEILRPQQQYKWKHDFWVSTQFESIYPLRFTNMKWLYNVHCAACIFPHAPQTKREYSLQPCQSFRNIVHLTLPRKLDISKFMTVYVMVNVPWSHSFRLESQQSLHICCFMGFTCKLSYSMLLNAGMS